MASKLTSEEYISKAKSIHGERYDYSRVSYNGSHKKVSIICREHGEFEMLAYCHTNGKQNCPRCRFNAELTEIDFAERVRTKHGELFRYHSDFTGIRNPVKIECKDHGVFTAASAETHLRHDGCCPTCTISTRMRNLRTGNISKTEKDWLDSLDVPVRQYSIKVESNVYVVDGFDPSTNTIYECYGSFWHGDPAFYNPKDNNPVLGVSFGELFEKTKDREMKIQAAGYAVVSKWVR